MTGIASRSQLRMSFLRWALVTVPAVVLLGSLSGRIANSGYGNNWFDALAKPEIMPPGWVFGATWTILYIFLGLSLAMILNARGARGRGLALALFAVQLLLNYSWSPVFFAMHQVTAAFLIILVMALLTAVMALLFYRIRRASAWLLLPYLAWLCFAGFLTWRIDALNPDAERLVVDGASADIGS